ncbi:DNA-binding response regulator [Spongiactinospora rosea]|uniref:DNA-binding response regulator n=1 Tax=Spongiactinospora rosea TaxID=2248750 RepID=A0A366LCX7_9ACTN|nr:response regulator transcription factor [Spongiactinospora rosea]RBQ11630.1 DNA-binding response regulator [Spongiactinospora rosea]
MIRVLLADDEELSSTLRMLLQLEPDIRVVTQVSRADAIPSAMIKHCPDVMVLGVGMLGTEGLTAANLYNNRHCRIILSMSIGTPGLLRDAMAVGISGFLDNSSAEDLVQAIHRVHEGGRYIDTDLAAGSMGTGDGLSALGRDARR